MLKHVACLYILILTQTALAQTELLPAPTGPHKTGRVSLHWVDDAREELETKADGDQRELMIHVFYPADPSATGERAVYVPDADAMRGPWKDDQIARIAALRAFSIENAPLPPGDEKYPVLVFSPGGGMKALTYHVLLEDLASHGWVVAAIDPPYNAKAVRLPDGRVLGNLKPDERGWPQSKNRDEFARFYTERIAHWSNDIRFVIDQLTSLDSGDGPFADRLDLEKGVGALGHSRGGQAAAAVRVIDERVKGGVNIDGTAGEHAVLPIQGPDKVGAQPLLWIQKSLPDPPADEQLARAKRTRAEYDAEIARILSTWDQELGGIAGGAIRLIVDRPGIQHIDFSDEPFWDGTLSDENRPGRLQTIADTRAWLRAFFDATVRGETQALKSLAEDSTNIDRGITVHVHGNPWQ